MNDEELRRKLLDAMVPGSEVTLDPTEAESVGAFVEDALGEDDARDAAMDLVLIHEVP